ncbi:MAG: 50S ribosomal protein L24 [Clostridium sp.]|nr:50S ribosomal protein L24 [Clostridium sp.]MCM1443815.1 50S ribosomal protein L24 [Candidatus Amulumruptor caecigallinarius]
MEFKTGDKVVVISGKSKGKEGTITKVLRKENKVIVEGANMIKKHIKPNGQSAGSIVDMESPIDASNVMIIDPKTKKRTRIGHTTDKKGKKIRVSKKSNENLD